ncbi:SDR family NAD(P)-dependent oxidoreductase [Sphingomonas koreensis]|uniref:SDR family NAD(P)-dependent oxidoreductase n=1 Tax=Sphingomonas koreensis TaxID=93064 RepID=UPI000F7FA27B|nr:SDR family NAD(P)-dependent oxidoreductase [Sphingomonas koreensis]RSU86926.1 SDR family NAD(P)-dependent oxidoreductase [Sphingomonas koreensis]
MTKRILVLGATSEIAEETARLYAAEGARFVLAGRDPVRLADIAADLRVRGASLAEVDAVDLAAADVETCTQRWIGILGGLDLVLLAYGVLGDQRTDEADLSAAAAMIDTNFRSASLWCLATARHLEAAGSGTLAVIGSVAGDRGRQSNYLYGATKAGLAALVEGIAHRLAPTGARAVLIKPGFVDTAMTAHIQPKGAFWSSPAKIAARIRKAVEGKGTVVYAPGYWRLIMTIVRSVPTPIFHRTKL